MYRRTRSKIPTIFQLFRFCVAEIRFCVLQTAVGLHFSSTITTVRIALWKPVWNKSLLQYWRKSNSHHTFVSFVFPQHYFTLQSVRPERITTKVIICTYWWWCNCRTRNWTRQTLGTCPQCAVSREQENTEIFPQSLLRKTFMDRFLV